MKDGIFLFCMVVSLALGILLGFTFQWRYEFIQSESYKIDIEETTIPQNIKIVIQIPAGHTAYIDSNMVVVEKTEEIN